MSNPAEKSPRDFDYLALPVLTLLKHPGPSVPRRNESLERRSPVPATELSCLRAPWIWSSMWGLHSIRAGRANPTRPRIGYQSMMHDNAASTHAISQLQPFKRCCEKKKSPSTRPSLLPSYADHSNFSLDPSRRPVVSILFVSGEACSRYRRWIEEQGPRSARHNIRTLPLRRALAIMEEACCTCARLLSAVPRISATEKPLPDDRRLGCCSRVICSDCIQVRS